MTVSYDPSGEVVEICRDLIRIDTTNTGDGGGPGERKAAEYVAGLLDEVGIESQLFESEPGRTSLVARWGGDEGEALLLHGHLDVVPADAADWRVDPFAGEIADGYLWGRGAVDMKDFDAMVLSLVRARARAGAAPRRPGLIDDCQVAIGEVGGFSATVRDRRLYLIQVAEKGMAWMRLTADGRAGHGSMRHPDNAVTRLAAAVARLGQHEWPVRLTPTMQVLLASVAEIAGTEATPENAEALVEEFGAASRMLGAVLRNTANPTMLQAGYKLNVVPGHAVAHVDGRFLPGYEDEFFATLAELVGEGIGIEWVSRQTALETSFDGEIADAMNAALLAADPDALVAPYLMSGGTDGKHWAKLGMRCFGFAPLDLPPDLDFTALFHGVDERVPTASLEFGARVLDDFLGRL